MSPCVCVAYNNNNNNNYIPNNKKRRLGRCCYFHIRIERELQNNKITIALNKIKIKISLPILNWILNTVMVMVIGNENWKRIAEKEKEISSN